MLFSYGALDTPWVSEYTLLSCIFASSECNHTKENRMGDVYSKHTNITFGWLGFIWGNCCIPKWCWMVSEQKCFQPQIGHTCQSPCGIKSLFLSFLQLHSIVTNGVFVPFECAYRESTNQVQVLHEAGFYSGHLLLPNIWYLLSIHNEISDNDYLLMWGTFTGSPFALYNIHW